MSLYRPGTMFQKLYGSAFFAFQPGFHPIPGCNSNKIFFSALCFTKTQQRQKRLFHSSTMQKRLTERKNEYKNGVSTLSCVKRLHETLRPFRAPDDVMPCDVTICIEGTEKTKRETFKAHKYMYTDDQSGLTMENAMDFLSCTSFFQAEGLTRICRGFIEMGLTAANACHVFQQARGMSEVRMAQLALSVICKSPEGAFASPGFLQLSPSDLKMILDRNDMNMPEPLIYQHLRRWAVNRMCQPDFSGRKNLREAIGELRFAIRFLMGDSELLESGPIKDRVVTLHELKKCESATDAANRPFSCTPRQPAPAPFYVSFQIGCDAFGQDKPDDLTSRVVIELCPEFALQTCAYARKLFEHIPNTEDYRDVRLVLCNEFYIEESSNVLQPPESLAQETSLLSPTVPGALCFGWHDNHCIPERFTWSRRPRYDRDAVYSIWLASEKPGGGTVFGRIVHGLDLLQSVKNHAGQLPCCYITYWTTNWCLHDNFPAKLESKYVGLLVEDGEPDGPEYCEQNNKGDDEEEEADSDDSNEPTERN